MIYLHRYTRQRHGYAVDIAVCEAEHRAARYEAQGFERCTWVECRAAWALRDELAKAEMQPPQPVQVAKPTNPTNSWRGG